VPLQIRVRLHHVAGQSTGLAQINTTAMYRQRSQRGHCLDS
jgi:hypothetical protein